MTVVAGQTKRFTAASPVTRFWLANSAGFKVEGGARGTVRRVVADTDPFVPAQLEIQHGRRRRRLPVSAVLEIRPEEQVVVVRGSDRARTQRVAFGKALGRVSVAIGVLVIALAAWLVRAGKETARLVRSLPWQQYGRSVRSGTTTLWREISTTWSLLLTTSSDPRNAKSSSERARTTSST